VRLPARRRLRTRTSKPTSAPSGPAGDTVAAKSGPGKMRRTKPQATSRQSAIQPNPWTQPSTSLAWSDSLPTHTTISAVKTHDSSAA
jgi:hypothetical protein